MVGQRDIALIKFRIVEIGRLVPEKIVRNLSRNNSRELKIVWNAGIADGFTVLIHEIQIELGIVGDMPSQ